LLGYVDATVHNVSRVSEPRRKMCEAVATNNITQIAGQRAHSVDVNSSFISSLLAVLPLIDQIHFSFGIRVHSLVINLATFNCQESSALTAVVCCTDNVILELGSEAERCKATFQDDMCIYQLHLVHCRCLAIATK
jgi:hypothetical protein